MSSVRAVSGSAALVMPEDMRTPFAPRLSALFTSSFVLMPAPQRSCVGFFMSDAASLMTLGFAVVTEIVPPINSWGSYAI